MKKLTVVKEEGDNYILKDKDENQYTLTLEFHDIDTKPTSKDNIYMSDKILDKNNEQYNTYYAFGKINNPYGRQIQNEIDEDIIIIEKQDSERIIMKRLYG